ncbi:MAG: hypothetical protein PHH96_02880 [Smithellaceae bacterium]|nr:hypothetical protein [Smithellaceae bacterium]
MSRNCGMQEEFESIRRRMEIHMHQNQIADDRSFGCEDQLLGSTHRSS